MRPLRRDGKLCRFESIHSQTSNPRSRRKKINAFRTLDLDVMFYLLQTAGQQHHPHPRRRFVRCLWLRFERLFSTDVVQLCRLLISLSAACKFSIDNNVWTLMCARRLVWNGQRSVFLLCRKKKIEVLRCVSVVSIHILMNGPTDRYPTCAHLLAALRMFMSEAGRWWEWGGIHKAPPSYNGTFGARWFTWFWSDAKWLVIDIRWVVFGHVEL